MVEMAFAEIARLSEEVEVLRVKLNEEEERRREAEEGWQRAEEKTEGIEQETREECWGEMERRLEEERRRWISAWAEEVRTFFFFFFLWFVVVVEVVIRMARMLKLKRPIGMTSIWIGNSKS